MHFRPASRSRSPKLKLASGDKVCSRKGGKPRLRSKLSKCTPNNQQVMCIRTRLTHAQPPPNSLVLNPGSPAPFWQCSPGIRTTSCRTCTNAGPLDFSLGAASRSPEPGLQGRGNSNLQGPSALLVAHRWNPRRKLQPGNMKATSAKEGQHERNHLLGESGWVSRVVRLVKIDGSRDSHSLWARSSQLQLSQLLQDSSCLDCIC